MGPVAEAFTACFMKPCCYFVQTVTCLLKNENQGMLSMLKWTDIETVQEGEGVYEAGQPAS